MSRKKAKQKFRKSNSSQNDEIDSSDITGNITISELIGDINGELQQALLEEDEQSDRPADPSE